MAHTPLDPAHRQPSTEPGADFYDYAVGAWVSETSLPPEYSRWGSFEELQEENFAQLKTICEQPELFAHTPLEQLAQKVALLYSLGMDEERVNGGGNVAIAAELEAIDGIETAQQLPAVLARLHRFCAPLFGFTATPDAMDSSMMIAGVHQGGLGLPDRDYYLSSEERFVQIQKAYREHMVRMHQLAGLGEAAARAACSEVYRIEEQLARVSTAREDLRDPHKNYHKMSVTELCTIAPAFDWQTFMVGLEVSTHTVDVGQLEFIKGVSDIISREPVSALRLYLRWHVFKSMGRYLTPEFENELFAFEGQILSGQKEMKPRWKRVIRTVGMVLDMAVGQLYAARHFPDEARARAMDLVHALVTTFSERINNLEWMSAATKEAAQIKLSAIRPKIGHPEAWRDYTRLTIDAHVSYAENIMRIGAFNTAFELAKIDKPVDKNEWFVSPHVINAFYDPQKNEIVFPAAILQPPFFYADADDAVNYGAIGGIIGHELTHGFDDEGRKFDEKGNMRDWWTAEDETKFKGHTARLVEQFNAYTPLENIHVNGRFTLGENIADLGGIAIAYEALQKVLGDKREKIDDLTPEQRFFLSWAEGWRHVIAPEFAKLLLTIDPHAPGKYRVLGPLSNTDAFYDAFAVTPGQAMYRPADERVRIW